MPFLTSRQKFARGSRSLTEVKHHPINKLSHHIPGNRECRVSTLLRPLGWHRRMTQKGHEERFPPRTLRVGLGSVAGFQRATIGASERLSKPPDFQPKIAVANFLDYEKSRAAAKSRIANLKIAALRRRKSPRQVQRFLSVHDQVANLFPRRRDHDTAANIRSGRTRAFAIWTDVTGVVMAA